MNKFWKFRPDIAVELGFDSAVLLAFFEDLQEYNDKLGRNNTGGFFPASVDFVTEKTTIERRRQTKSLKKLMEFKLVEVKYFGFKRYIKVN